ncbi:dienelactone hydrolase family protein [Leucobacter sp.]
MAEMMLFHHVLGLTTGVRAFADRLRDRGHVVHAPDLFEGRTFTTIEHGFAYVERVGSGTVADRAATAAAELAEGVVFGGISLGVLPAQQLLQTVPGALGGLFIAAFVDPDSLEGSWPGDVRVQVHATEGDPFFMDEGDVEAARAVQSSHPGFELFLSPGSGHLFVDSSTPDYDAAATELVLDRADALLRAVSPPA